MSSHKLIYQKHDLRDKTKWSMDRLKAKAHEWGGDDKLNHRWHFINFIYESDNNKQTSGCYLLCINITKSI